MVLGIVLVITLKFWELVSVLPHRFEDYFKTLTWKAVNSTRWTWSPSCPRRSLPDKQKTTWGMLHLMKLSIWDVPVPLYLGMVSGCALNEHILSLQSNFWMIPWRVQDGCLEQDIHKNYVVHLKIASSSRWAAFFLIVAMFCSTHVLWCIVGLVNLEKQV